MTRRTQQDADLSYSSGEHFNDEGSRSFESPRYSKRTRSTSSTYQPARASNSIRDEAVTIVKQRLLQQLKNASYQQVEDVKIGATGTYEDIKKVGGDPAGIQAIVDSYARDVEAFLIVKKDTTEGSHIDEVAHDILKVEACLQTAKTALENALQTSENQKKQLSLAVKEKAALEALLQALCERETSLKEQHLKQHEVTLAAKSKVRSLQQKLANLNSIRQEANALEKMQNMLEEKRKYLDEDAAMHWG